MCKEKHVIYNCSFFYSFGCDKTQKKCCFGIQKLIENGKRFFKGFDRIVMFDHEEEEHEWMVFY